MEVDATTWSPGAAYHFLTSAVAPRPIAWVTTQDPETGVVNAAPFSWYQAVCAEPPMLMLAILDRPDGSPKDTARNLQSSGECVVHIAARQHADSLVASSGDYPPDASEVDHLNLATTPSRRVGPPRLTHAPVAMECRVETIHKLGRTGNLNLVLLEILHVAAHDDILDDRGNVDPGKVSLLARLGGRNYIAVKPEDVFQIDRGRAVDEVRRD